MTAKKARQHPFELGELARKAEKRGVNRCFIVTQVGDDRKIFFGGHYE